MPEARRIESGGAGHLLLFVPPALLGLGRRDVADRLKEAAVVEPVDLFEGRTPDGFQGPPRSAPMDHLGFVQPVDRLGEGVVVGIPDTAHRRHHAGLGEALGFADRKGLAA